MKRENRQEKQSRDSRIWKKAVKIKRVMRSADKNPKKMSPALFTVFFVLAVFCILTATTGIMSAVIIIMMQTGLITVRETQSTHMGFLILGFAFASIAVGTILTALLGRIPMKPVNRLIRGMNRLAEGDYRVRLHPGGDRFSREMAESFNTLAEELSNTEMLRSDFVNNFSHEFKTPIVSLLGFARLLGRDRGNLSEEQKREYLKIIEEEAQRLSVMATNVLNLTKIENQTILTGKSVFNLSEQVRTCILLLEKKWMEKDISVSVDFQEYEISANEEMLRQVWINLLDNAVKFTPQNGEIAVGIREREDTVCVSIRNTGSQISPPDQEHIFRKFYQADNSHSGEGTGLGLAIAKKITQLHDGVISVFSDSSGTEFTVTLPRYRRDSAAQK